MKNPQTLDIWRSKKNWSEHRIIPKWKEEKTNKQKQERCWNFKEVDSTVDHFKWKAHSFNFLIIVATYVLWDVLTKYTDFQNKFCSEMVDSSTTFQIAFIGMEQSEGSKGR